MAEPVGVVLLAESGEHGAFVRPVEIEAFRDLIVLMLRKPTVAGPPLIPGPLEALAAKLAAPFVGEPGRPAVIRLSPVDLECLTLLRHQIALRERLPLRIQRTCVTCGNTKIVNPNLVKKSNNGEILGTAANAAVDTIGMVADGHYVRAVFKVMGTAGTIAGKVKEAGPVCEECEGQEFATPAVTYCPHCKKLRPETILLECPDCGADFVDATDEVDPWLSADRAFAESRRTAILDVFEQHAGAFEKGFYAGQKRALTGALTGDDELLCLCRCARPGETLRAVALLLTSRQLIWSRQLVGGDVTSDAVPWTAVSRIDTVPSRDGPVLEVQTSTGERLSFTGFKGAGIGFGGRMYAFTAAAIARLIGELTAIDVSAGPPTLPPSPYPPPAAGPWSPTGPPGYPRSPIYPTPAVYPPIRPAPDSRFAPPGSDAPTWIVSAPPTEPTPDLATTDLGAQGLGTLDPDTGGAAAPPVRAVAQVYPKPPAPARVPPPIHVPAAPIRNPIPAPAGDLSAVPPPEPPAAPGWYADPLGTYRFRWWDGKRWTTTFHR